MMVIVSREEKAACQHLIIGGAPKSATTSLFRYLADHPQVCPANRKETYFFAREYDLAKVCSLSETSEAFESYFTHCDSLNKLRVEATPYTLYSEGAAQKIATLIPNVTVLFVLRDPVERLLSDYYFHIQREHPDAQGTFEEFIEWQLGMRGRIANLLEQGCYIKYLRSFLTDFGPGEIQVLFFEELKANPAAELRKLCVAMGVNSEFFSNYNFAYHNKTISVRYKWLNRIGSTKMEPFVAEIRARLIQSPKIYRRFENIVGAVKSAYRILNDSGLDSKELIADDELAKLVDYYRPYSQALAKELGRQLPWKSLQ